MAETAPDPHPGPPGPVGRVIGTEDATPLEFWVAIADDQYLQLDDVVATDRILPDGQRVELFGMVEQVRARHEGARFDSDVFLIDDGVLPAEVVQAAQVMTTRVEPEVFVPPLPGAAVRKATGDERGRALYFDDMARRCRPACPATASRSSSTSSSSTAPAAPTSTSPASRGVATKTTYATFLLYSLFHSGVLGAAQANTKALIFNVKGEDLLFLDHPNARLDDTQRDRYGKLGLPAGPFRSVGIVAPPRPGDAAAQPFVGARASGVKPFFWTIEEFCAQRLLPFLFADAEDDRQQYTMVVHNVARRLEEATPAGARRGEHRGHHHPHLPRPRRAHRRPAERRRHRRRVGGPRHRQRHRRRLRPPPVRVGRPHRPPGPRRRRTPAAIRVDLDANQVTVVDIHNLNDRAKRFVVGVVLRQAFEAKERSGTAEPLQFVVLDELNKYAPREGSSPIKEILLDVAERGRSSASSSSAPSRPPARSSAASSPTRPSGSSAGSTPPRPAAASTASCRRCSASGPPSSSPGTMIVSQPQLPVPLVVEFPFPAWATRVAETRRPAATRPRPTVPADPFEGLD